MTWGWLFVGVIVIFVGLSMAEICSSYPTAGGLYYWAAKLAPGNSGPIWSWFTGWFNLVGQVAVTAGISFGCAYSICCLPRGMDRPTRTGCRRAHPSPSWPSSSSLQGLLNTFSIRLVALLNDVSVWWHLIGVAVIVIILFWAPSRRHEHQNSPRSCSAARAGTRSRGSRDSRRRSTCSLLGLLNAQYTFTGYDASAHVSEETISANVQAAKGIVRSIWVSLIAGFILLVGVSYALPKTSHPVDFAGTTFTSVQDLAAGHHPLGGGLHGHGRPDARPAAHRDRHRGAVLLRHVVGHGELAHDLRLLA